MTAIDELREQLDTAKHNRVRNAREYARLCHENDRLRELVQDMYESMDASCQFGRAIPAGTMAHVKNRAIGLGIEVDNG